MSDEINAQDPGDEHVDMKIEWTCVYGGSWMYVHPMLLGLHWEFVRDVNDGHDDVHGTWQLLYDNGLPAKPQDRELVLGVFTPPVAPGARIESVYTITNL